MAEKFGSIFDEIDAAGGGTEIAPAAKAGAAGSQAVCVVRTMKLREAQRIAIGLMPDVLDEIGRPTRVRVALATSGDQLVFVLTADDAKGRFEWNAIGKNARRLYIRLPVPAGLVWREGSTDPEIWVDRLGKRIAVEVPDFLRPGPPATVAPKAPVIDRKAVAAAVPAPSFGRPMPRASSRATADDDAAAIRAFLGLDRDPLPREIGGVHLTPALAQVAILFSKREFVTVQAIMAATADPTNPEDERDGKLADVYVCKLRSAFEPLGLTITTLRGEGWTMPGGQRARLRDLIDAARKELAA